MNIIAQRVSQLTLEQKLQIVKDHKRFEKDGSIGDCLLRQEAAKLKNHLGEVGGVTLWMESIANAVYRSFAESHIEELDDWK